MCVIPQLVQSTLRLMNEVPYYNHMVVYIVHMSLMLKVLMFSMKYGNLLLYDIILHVIYQSESNSCRYSHVV